MGLFGIMKFYLKDFCETILVYAKARLLLVGQKNSAFGNNGTLNLNSINIFGDKVACRKDLIYLERDLIVGGKDLKIGGIELNNWWKENIILVGQSSVLCTVKLFLWRFINNL